MAVSTRQRWYWFKFQCQHCGADSKAVNGGDKVGRVGGRLLSIGDLIVYRLPSFIGL